jgi:K+-transporting ATPase ATPase C chain
VGRVFFPSAATGSIVSDKGADGKEVLRGSHLIGQPFSDDAYFWPRPSAVDYNATASGASNYGANNPKLRDRVAQKLGPLVVYKKESPSVGQDANNPRTPQLDIETWFGAKPDRVAAWAAEFETAAGNWAKTDLSNDEYGLPGKFILAWAQDHPEIIVEWKKSHLTKTDYKPEDLVSLFFASFAKVHPGKWPGVVEIEQADKTKTKRIEPVASDAALASNTPGICGNFFEMWLRDPANKDKASDLEPVVADMVMTSGSGLDPDISLRNALSVYQLNRVAAKRTPRGGDVKKTREEISVLVRTLSFTPLSGLIGEPLVNVLDLNRELDAKFPVAPSSNP